MQPRVRGSVEVRGRRRRAVAVGQAALGGAGRHLALQGPGEGSGGRRRRRHVVDGPGRGAARLQRRHGVRVRVADGVRLRRRQRVRVRVVGLRGRRQRVVGQGVRVGVDHLHGRLLVGGRLVVRVEVLVLLVVEAAVALQGAAAARLPPAGRPVLAVARRAVVGHGKAQARARRWLGGEVAWGRDRRSAPPGRRGHGLADHGGVGDVGSRRGGGLGQLSAAAARRAGPRRGGDGAAADRTTALHEK